MGRSTSTARLTGVNDDQVVVIAAGGRELRVLGVRTFGGRVEVVVDGAAR